MSASPIATARQSLTAPVIDYEPPPVGTTAPCPMPTSTAMHRRTPRPMTPATRPRREAPVPRAAAVFADAALRRVLEVVDRRRPVGQLRAMLRPNLVDAVSVLTRTPSPEGAAALKRVRLRAVSGCPGEPSAAEVFATYTRGKRVRAVAGRVEVVGGRWQVVALQIG
ncbi:hypothetical protein MARA_23870 [Mycolicibacterium arabiense]|uniref:Alanine, arginine and proline rich protein n=1 Tax=Mycolicibacterium arabiense TaxID=1286181 RepID=A0A7I7RY96_9MYCO|nr:Rv3235 family protein [Mycolicibacterium arabiense]MCV7373674.1 hypothetical protein [Mycolicibacterium arabiense]BBY48919.1 hypothetical protein MARA_23870 [Mycolicibacterium arabiense]